MEANTRKRKRVRISPQFMLELVTEGQFVWGECITGTPSGTRFIGMTYDPFVDMCHMVLEHDSWPNVPEGVQLPELVPIYAKESQAHEATK